MNAFLDGYIVELGFNSMSVRCDTCGEKFFATSPVTVSVLTTWCGQHECKPVMTDAEKEAVAREAYNTFRTARASGTLVQWDHIDPVLKALWRDVAVRAVRVYLQCVPQGGMCNDTAHAVSGGGGGSSVR